MVEAFKLLTVFVLAAVALWSAIPVGLAAGLKPAMVLVVALVGNVASVTGVAMAGEQVRNWLLERFGRKKTQRKDGVVWRIWHRYGVVGLALVSPWILGAPVAAAFGMGLGIPARRLLLWMLPSAVLRVVVFTAGASLGWLGLQQILSN